MKWAIIAFFLNIAIHSHAQPVLQWYKLHNATDVVQTADGGYILTGGVQVGTTSAISVTKTDSIGNALWQKNFNGIKSEAGRSVIETADGGYIVTGNTNSPYPDAHGGQDIWIGKLTGAGVLVWEKCYGGSGSEFPANIVATADGGYIFTGSTTSNDGQVSGNHGGNDIWLVKISGAGQLLWQRCFGGSDGDYANCITPAADGNFLIAGSTRSGDGNFTAHYGTSAAFDGYLFKVSTSGALLWQKNYGGTGSDAFTVVRQAEGGNIILAGASQSTDYDLTSDDTLTRVWVLKTDNMGNVNWSKTYIEPAATTIGGNAGIRNLIQAFDGSYVVATAKNELKQPLWLAGLSIDGDMKWEREVPDTNFGGCTKLIQTRDTGFTLGSWAWLIRLGPYHDATHVGEMSGAGQVSIYPNPSSGIYYLQLPAAWIDANITVMDITGRVINVLLTDEGNTRKLQFQGTPPGMYILTINTAMGIYTYKLMYCP